MKLEMRSVRGFGNVLDLSARRISSQPPSCGDALISLPGFKARLPHRPAAGVQQEQRRAQQVCSSTDNSGFYARSIASKRCIRTYHGRALCQRPYAKVVSSAPSISHAGAVRLVSCWQGPRRRDDGVHGVGVALSKPLGNATTTRSDECSVTSPGVTQEAAVGDSPSTRASSLQEILGITDAEAHSLRDKPQVTEPGFHNLTTTPPPPSTTTTTTTRVGSEGVKEGSQSRSFASFLLDELNAEPKDVKALVLRSPGVLRRSTGAVGAVSRWLQKGGLGMSRAEVTRLLLRYPEAGQLSVETNLEPKVAWLRENLGTDDRGVARVLRHAPQILGRSVETSLEPRLKWLEVRLRVSRDKAAKMARTFPALFVYSAENKLEPTLAWLQERLGIEDEGVVLAMVAAAPTILSMNVKTGLEPKLCWLRDRLGLNHAEICRMIRSHPTILIRSVDKSLEPKLVWLKDTLGLDQEAAKVMLLRYPTISGASLDQNLKLKLPWLRKTLGLTPEEAVSLAKRVPALLTLSLKGNLEPTVAFYREEMCASEDDLRWSLLQNPALLTLSLDGRLRPRASAMRAAKVEPLFSKHQEHVILWTDAKFRDFIRHVHVATINSGDL